jgi:HSP20 family protein
MNLIHKQRTFFPSLIDDYFNQEWDFKIPNYSSLPAVNIKELDTHFDIHLAVPGMKKSDFEIEVDNGLLSISSSTSNKDSAEEEFTRHEFSFNSFKRTFTIPESVDPTKVDACYSNGVLQISLPKRKEALPQPKKVIKIR